MPYAMVTVLTNVAVADEPAHRPIRKPTLITSARPRAQHLVHRRGDDLVDDARRERPVDASSSDCSIWLTVDGAEQPGQVADAAQQGQEQRRQRQQLPEGGLRGQPEHPVVPGLGRGPAQDDDVPLARHRPGHLHRTASAARRGRSCTPRRAAPGRRRGRTSSPRHRVTGGGHHPKCAPAPAARTRRVPRATPGGRRRAVPGRVGNADCRPRRDVPAGGDRCPRTVCRTAGGCVTAERQGTVPPRRASDRAAAADLAAPGAVGVPAAPAGRLPRGGDARAPARRRSRCGSRPSCSPTGPSPRSPWSRRPST